MSNFNAIAKKKLINPGIDSKVEKEILVHVKIDKPTFDKK